MEVEVVDSIEGLSPSLGEHETVVDLEPNTGVGMHFARKLQINVAVNNYPDLMFVLFLLSGKAKALVAVFAASSRT